MSELKFKAPIDGVMLPDSAGRVSGGALCIRVALAADDGRKISVNGISAEPCDGLYVAEVPLTQYETTLCARDNASGESQCITVYRLYDAGYHYRVSVDDGIWFLQDIARHNYESIFDNPFLALYRDIHDTYKTKIHINLYYCCPENGGFNLTQMPDRYRDEWRRNSDWLRLSFHAFKNLPDRPYDNSTYEQAYGECEMVNREILRFAGKETLSDYTTIHWCSGNAETCRAFRELGYKSIQAESVYVTDGVFSVPIAYHLPDDVFLDGIAQYGYYKDRAEDIIYTTADIILNLPDKTPTEIRKHLSAVRRAYPMRNYMELLIHEQYFYKDYVAFLPDYRARIAAGCEWCIENGYTSSFRGDIVRR